MPQYASLSHAELNAIHILREMSDDKTRKAVKSQIFARAKSAFGIPATHKLVVEADVQVAGAGVLRNKQTRETYPLNPDTGKWVHAANGAATGKRWYMVSADDMAQAVRDALDNMDSDDMVTLNTKPSGALVQFKDSDDEIVIDAQGNTWIELDADAYDAPESSGNTEDEDDDSAY